MSSRWPILQIERVTTAVVALALYGLAAWTRLSWLPDLSIDPDWAWFMRVGSQTGHGEAWVGPAMFMYSTLPSLLFGLLARLMGDGPSTIVVWTALGGLAAPLTLLAVRRVAGLPPGVVAGLVIALSDTQIWVTVGLKSPYFVALASALLALGLAEAVARRPWGALLASQGATLMASLHIGLAPAGAFAVLAALALLVRLPGRRARLVGLAGWLLGTLPITAWVLYVDRSRLLRDLAIHAADPWTSEGDTAELLTRVEQGLSLTMDTGRVLLGLGLAGLLLAPLYLRWRRSRDPAEALSSYREGLTASALVGATFVLSLAPYLYQVKALHYFEVHHAVGCVPLGLVALSGLARALGPPRPALLGAGIAALTLAPWLADARDLHWTRPPQKNPLRDWPVQRALAEAIRAASGPAQPVVLAWLDEGRGHDPETVTRVLSELVRVGPYTEREAPTCFVLTDAVARADLPGMAVLLELPDEAGLLLADPGCAVLPTLSSRLCSKPEDRLLGLRHDYGGYVAEQALLPECYGRKPG